MSDTFTQKPFAVANIELLEPLFEQIFNPIMITTSQLELPGPQIVYVNKAFCMHTGYEKGELIGKTPRIFQGKKTQREVLEKLKRTLLAGEFFQDSAINYKKDGSEYWVEWNISPMYNTHGEVTHYYCVQHDISVYKELESSRKLLQEYKDAVDESSIASKTNPFGIITFVNQKFCEISGYEEEELLGKSHAVLRHPDMPKELFKDMWHTIKELKKTWRGKIKNRTKDGGFYWVDATIKPILDINGDVLEFISLRNDITELESYKESLSFSLQEYEDAIINNSAIAKLATDFTITFVNDQYTQLSGYEYEEMVGKPIIDFVEEESLSDLGKILTTIQSGETCKGVFKGKPKNAKPFYTKTTIKPIKDTAGEIVEYLLIKNDITELLNAHLEIEETQKEIVYKMGEIGESRSQETGNHVKRVAEYSKLLAHLYGLSKEESETLFIASPMHDIGKVAIADNILNKPGKLSVEEFEVMKSHASIGYEVLKGSSRKILQAAAIVAHEHHEKWDGTGYPRGLNGEDIHIFGRITAIADVFDALGNDRCYKKAWELEKILALFEEGKGKHFDPKLIDLFMENLDKFLAIRDKFQD